MRKGHLRSCLWSSEHEGLSSGKFGKTLRKLKKCSSMFVRWLRILGTGSCSNRRARSKRNLQFCRKGRRWRKHLETPNCNLKAFQPKKCSKLSLSKSRTSLAPSGTSKLWRTRSIYTWSKGCKRLKPRSKR